jgi:hypothetical protein
MNTTAMLVKNAQRIMTAPPGGNIHWTSLSISYRSGSAGFVVTHISAVRFAALSNEEMNRQGTAVVKNQRYLVVLWT